MKRVLELGFKRQLNNWTSCSSNLPTGLRFWWMENQDLFTCFLFLTSSYAAHFYILSTEPYIKKKKPKGGKWTMSQVNLQFCGDDVFLWCKICSLLHSSYGYTHLGKCICYFKLKVLWKNEGMETCLNNTSTYSFKNSFLHSIYAVQ